MKKCCNFFFFKVSGQQELCQLRFLLVWPGRCVLKNVHIQIYLVMNQSGKNDLIFTFFLLQYNLVQEEKEEEAGNKVVMATKLVLETDKREGKEGKVLIEVHKDIINKLKPHQVEGTSRTGGISYRIIFTTHRK